MSRTRIVLIAAAVLVLVVGCVFLVRACSEDHLDHGTVIKKIHEPERDYVMFIPIQTGSVCSKAGTSTACTPIYSQFPFMVHDGEDFKLRLRDGKKTGVTYVSRTAFDRTSVGEPFGGGTSKDANNSKRRKS